MNEKVVLAASKLNVGYGDVPVVRNVDLEVRRGEVVVLLGANGAGKTTTLRCLAGVLTHGAGTVHLKGTKTRQPLHKRARQGLGFVSDERSVIMGLTVAENIRLAGVSAETVYARFPGLEARAGTKAGLLSGGEQQMLTLARLLARGPDVLLADEVSLGLAPLIVRQLLRAIREAADSGLAALIVEQHVRQALEFADRAYVMRRGEVVFSGTADECHSRLDEIERSYLGAVSAMED
ncbi:MAG TPA: ABC transporter ATP-binding protein [Amycolatopsis sp.]|nr:ABC transporter ATP-binding protein [Amycolatopsis sp.]